MVEGKCPECGSEELINDYDRAEVVCARCGLVIDETDPDLNYRLNQCDNLRKDKSNIIEDSTTFSIYNKGLGTKIDKNNNDSDGQKISSRYSNQMYKLRKWEHRTNLSGAHERNLLQALSEIDNYGSKLRFSKSMKEDCSIIYREALSIGIHKGRGISKTVAGCLFITSRRFKAPFTLEDIAEISGITKKELTSSYKEICYWLEIKLPLMSPLDFVPRYASELGLSGEIEAKAIELIQKSKGVVQGNQKITAVSALYTVSKSVGKKLTLKYIKEVTGVSGPAINSRSEKLIQYLD